MSITVLLVNVEMSISTQRFLDVPPYNLFTGSCSAVVRIPGLDEPHKLATDWQWRRKGEGEREFHDITDTSINNGSLTTLTYTEIMNGSVSYQCIFSLEGVDSISTYDTVTVFVVGKS